MHHLGESLGPCPIQPVQHRQGHHQFLGGYPTLQAAGGLYSSEWPVAAWETFGGRRSALACAAALLGQLLGICWAEVRGDWLWCSRAFYVVALGSAMVQELNLH